MIDPKTLNLITENGLKAFAEGRLLDGIAALRTLTPYCAEDTLLCAEIDSLEENYHCMLTFLRRGGTDQQRSHVRSRILRQGIALLQQAHRDIRLIGDDDRYCTTLSGLVERYGIDTREAILQKWNSLLTPEEQSEAEDDLFDLIWTQLLWTARDTALWYDFITQQRDTVQQHLSGALFLAAWEYYDAEKIQLLNQLTDAPASRTRLQASTYLLFLHLRHQALSDIFPTLPESFTTSDGRKFIGQVQREILLMLLSEKDMESEFEESQELTKGLLSGEQPIDEAHIRDLFEMKARHLKNRIEKGLDINLSKASLLHKCKYMQRTSHWFLPFDKSLPLFQSVMMDENGQKKENFSLMVDLIEDCDVDKLATLYLISTDKDFSAIAKQLEDHELPVEKEDIIIPEYSLRHLIQDIYRVFLHSPLSNQLRNPFHQDAMLTDIPRFSHLLPEKQCLGICAALLELSRYDQAISLIDSVIERKGANTPLLLAKGQALLSQQRYAEAAGALRSAEFLDPDNTLILKMLIQCYAAMKRFEDEEECLRHFLDIKPDDASCRKLLPLAMVKGGKLEEALQSFFELDYAKPDDPDTIQCIATTAMKLGKLDLADRYTEKALQLTEGSKWLNYFRGGHIRLLRGDWKGAMDYYEQYVNTFCQETDQSASVALSQFDSERNGLCQQGLSAEDFLLTREMLQAAIEAKEC